MTCNTRIYNYSNLKSEDKQIVQAQLLMFKTVEDTITEYMYRRESSTNILDAVSYEEGIKALEQVQQNMFSDIVEYIVYAIDSYEEDVDEVDTQDPLLACIKKLRILIMNDLETCDFNTVNLERLAFYFEKLEEGEDK